MALITQAIRGTKDILPEESYKWQMIEETVLAVARDFGYKEMRTPVFEHTELFQRSVGETTDVVQKEMYTFEDRGGRSITLRPEGTAGMARAFLEHGLHNETLPIKVSYHANCYRYEKPQAGRYREFQQFGVECFGAPSPAADAEVISLGAMVLKELGVMSVDDNEKSDISLHINSIGCPDCRPNYHNALKEYFNSHKDSLCDTCLDRLDRNPMRILDCKSPVCSEIAKNAPVTLDYLCEECEDHFNQVRSYLDAVGLDHTIDTGIVRGLDYYTRTVFEFISSSLGAQAVVCGGGRYDGLMEELGGPHVPSLGFGMGIERLLMVMEANDVQLPPPPSCEVYIASIGNNAATKSFEIASQLRQGGVSAEYDIVGRSLKAQMRYADRIDAKYTIVLGDNELESGVANLRDMESGEQTEVALDGTLYTTIYNLSLDRQLSAMTDLFGEMTD